MNNQPLHYQVSSDQQHQQQQYAQPQQHNIMQGSPQHHVGSPMMQNGNHMLQQQRYNQQQQQQYHVHPGSPVVQNPNGMAHPHNHNQQDQYYQQQDQYYQQQDQYQQQYQQQQQQQYYAQNINRAQSMPPSLSPPSLVSSATGNNVASSGSRYKCDQVVYEAIAKACEVAVRSRCTDLVDGAMTLEGIARGGMRVGGDGTTTSANNGGSGSGGGGGGYRRSSSNDGTSAKQKRRSWNYYGGRNHHNHGPGGGGGGGGGSGSSTSGRFNIEVDEVPSVRSVVQSWKRSPHAPLRLDIYYEHDGCYDEEERQRQLEEEQQGRGDNESDGATTSPPPAPPPRQPPQRELLERWCIDYVPSSSPSNPGSVHQSRSSSPYNSPSSSPHSSRILTGSYVNSALSGSYHSDRSSSGGVSQLRQVCKRVVVLLRSLHCLTRMLPSYRLKCLLLSSVASGGGPVAANVPPGMTSHGELTGGDDAWSQSGWGSIGFSIHVGDGYRDEGEPSALPSPSFASQSLPSVPTPYGALRLSVMYDATLNPQDMVNDLLDRRTAWLQRQWAAAMGGGVGGQHVQQPQRQMCHVEEQRQYQPHSPYEQYQQYPTEGHATMGVTSASSTTRPIPISQLGHDHQQRAVATLPVAAHHHGSYDPHNGPRRHSSCPPTTLTGTPASASGGRSRAVSDFIISDYHSSPRLRSSSHSPKPTPRQLSLQRGGATGAMGISPSPGSGGGLHYKGGVGEKMSGLSLAMMAENDQSPIESYPNNAGGLGHQQQQQQQSPNATDYGHYPQEEQPQIQPQQHAGDGLGVPTFGSPATRAAFHNPPPEDFPGGDGGTHFFSKHAGYGYGYNGSNVQFDDGGRDDQRGGSEPPPPPPPPSLSPTAGDHSLMSPTPPLTRGNSVHDPPSPGAPGRNNPTPPPATASSTASGKSPNSPFPSQQRSMSRQRTTSSTSSHHHQSSMHELLPPMTSLDILAKSPFLSAAAARKAMSESKLLSNATSSSSIPRVVDDNNDVVVSALGSGGGEGGSSSNNPSMMIPSSKEEAEELPFAVDDDGHDNTHPIEKNGGEASGSPSKSGAAQHNSSRSLWGSTKADMLDGTLGGGRDGGMAEISSSLAVSSLHHRCSADGAVGLKMFESRLGSSPKVADVVGTEQPSANFPSIKDQLSDFHSFGASLMVGSSHSQRSHNSQSDS